METTGKMPVAGNTKIMQNYYNNLKQALKQQLTGININQKHQ